MTSKKWNHIKTCFVLSLLCSIWNLYGDIYFLDFYVAHMSFDENASFASIRETSQSGNIWLFDSSHHSPFWLFLAQAGGWMYPIWTYSTTLPLYVGLKDIGFWNSVVPCGILAYGLCIIGGALHSSFAFLTILPNAYHQLQATAVGENNEDYQQLAESSTFFDFLQTTQQTVVQHLFIGFLPGYVACNVAGIWIFVVVFIKSSQNSKFPKWYNLFNPITTAIWVSILSAILPDPWGFYIYGSLGTWGVLILNIGTSYYLWNDEVKFITPTSSSSYTSTTTPINEELTAESNVDYVGGNYLSYGSVPSLNIS